MENTNILEDRFSILVLLGFSKLIRVLYIFQEKSKGNHVGACVAITY